jgi:hypothetical protein
MKAFGIVLVVGILIAVAGFVYRSAAEHPNQQIACPLDAKVCPDGTSVGRSGEACTFAACPPPNVSLTDTGISYAVPSGFSATTSPDAAGVAAYSDMAGDASLIVRVYAVDASSTPLDTIQQTAIGGASGAPLPATAFSSVLLGNHRFTVANIERFEGVVDTAYYFALGDGSRVVRFDAIDANVSDWTDPDLTVTSLPAQAALIQLLSTLQGG